MIRRSTWIILGLFAVLLGGALFWQQTRQKNAPAEPTPTPGVQEYLFEMNGPTITAVTVQRSEDGKTLQMARLDGAWKLVQPATEFSDSPQIESAISSLLTARIIAKPSGATELEVLGLTPPAYTFVVSLDNGKQVTINVGKAAVAGTGYYVLSDARVVYLVNKAAFDTLIRMLDVPPLLPTPTPEPVLLPTEALTETPAVTPTP